MEFQHAMFTRSGVRNLKEIKRGNQPKKQEADESVELEEEPGEVRSPAAKKPRQDYSTFKGDVAQLQQNLEAFEQSLKEHTMQVQLKLSYILHALDEIHAGGEAPLAGLPLAAPPPPTAPVVMQPTVLG